VQSPVRYCIRTGPANLRVEALIDVYQSFVAPETHCLLVPQALQAALVHHFIPRKLPRPSAAARQHSHLQSNQIRRQACCLKRLLQITNMSG
jgi:hypothetical protein